MEDRHARHRRTVTDRRRRPVDGFRFAGAGRFERLVDDAVRGLPRPLLAYLDDVEVAVADLPPTDPDGAEAELRLGLYQVGGAGGGRRRARTPPDRITLFRRPLEARAHDKRDLADLVQETVVMELAEHLRLDDDRLDELGWR